MKNDVVRLTDNPSVTNIFLQQKEPFSFHLFTVIISAVFAFAMLFVCLGKMEVVVKASGIVRPLENISTVSNIVSGKLKNKFYHPGQSVKKDEVLYSLDNEAFFTQLRLLELKLSQLEKRKIALNLMSESFYKNKNIFESSNLFEEEEGDVLKEYSVKFKNFQIETFRLKKNLEKATRDFEVENSLPESAITKHRLNELQLVKDFAEIDFHSYKNRFEESFLQEKKEVSLGIEEIKNSIVQQTETIKYSEVVSPVDGTVMEISSLNVGDFLFANQQVLKIIPDAQEKNRIELQVADIDIGKIKVGDKVRYRFPAFPYYDFNGLTGTIVTINPDISISDNGRMYFSVVADVDDNSLTNRNGETHKISSGLSVQARIIQKEKRIIEWFLEKIDIQF